MATAATVFRDFVTDGVPSSGANKPKKLEIRALLGGYEAIISALGTAGGYVYVTKAILDASTTPPLHAMAWVVGDPVAANNGIYRKTASGTASWTRVSDLPFSFIVASDVGAGTANAIQATTSIPVSESALIWMNVFRANTGSATVAFNGGAALTIKTNTGANLASGALVPGMIVLGIVSGSNFRLVSDQASAAIVAAAEAAADRAEAAAEEAASAGNTRFAAVSTIANLKALDTTQKKTAYLQGRGMYEWRDGDYSASFVADTFEAVFIKANAVSTSLGAWVFMYDPDGIPVEQFGVIPDDVTRASANTIRIRTCVFPVCELLKVTPILQSGKKYEVSSSLTYNGLWLEMRSSGKDPAVIRTSQTSGTVLPIGLGRVPKLSLSITANINAGQKQINVGNHTGIEVNDLIQIRSTKAWYNDPREDADIAAQAYSILVAGSNTNTLRLHAGFTISDPSLMQGKSITLMTGPNAGLARKVTAYNDTTKVINVTPPFPSSPGADTYRFPQAFKGQLTRVQGKSGSGVVEVEDIITDSYYLTEEELTVDVYDGIHVAIENVNFEGPAGAGETVAVAVRSGEDIFISNVRTVNLKRTAINTSVCYRGTVVDCGGDAINDTATGYMVQMSSCAHVKALRPYARGSRRIVDVSGADTPSHHCVIDSADGTGGGAQEDGSAYWPVGAVENYAVGTHGAAVGTIFRNCRFSGVFEAIRIRGRDTLIENCVFLGGMDACINKSFGGRLEVVNCKADPGYYDNVSGTTKNTALSPSITPTRYAQDFLRLGVNAGTDDEIVVRDNTVRVRRSLIGIESVAGMNFKNLREWGNDVTFYPASSGDECALVTRILNSDTVQLTAPRLESIPRTAPGNTGMVLLGTGISHGVVVADNGSVGQYAGMRRYRLRLADDTVGVIPIGQNADSVIYFSVITEESATYWGCGWIRRNNATLQIIAQGGTSLEGFATAPTGASGTDIRIGLHFNKDLTIQNRLGATRTFIVEVGSTC